MMTKKILTLALFVGAMLLLTATAVLAASPVASNPHPILDEPPLAPTIAPTMGITNPVAVAIANFFFSDAFTETYTVTVQSVLNLHASGVGYGNMTIALFFARASGLSFEAIMAMRGSGEGGGWGYIIKNTSGLEDFSRKDTNLGAIMSGRATPPEPSEGDSGSEVQSASTKGPPHEPKGWEHGKGQGSQGQGHDKGQQGQPQGKGKGPKQ